MARGSGAVGQDLPVEPDEFWTVIDEARVRVADPVRDAGAVARAVEDVLATRPHEQVLGFDVVQRRISASARRQRLVDACALVNQYVSDDGFSDFLCWVQCQGRTVWEAAVAEPDSLADVLAPAAPRGLWCEPLHYAAAKAWRTVSGGDDDSFYEALDAFEEPDDGPLRSWSDDMLPDRAAVLAALPRLAALYG